VHCDVGETNPPYSIFQVIFVAYFSTGVVKCWGSSIGLGFVLVEQICNVQLCICQNGQWACSSHFSKLVLHFLDMEMVGFSTGMSVAWFLCSTSKPTFHHLWLSLKGTGGLFKACREALTCGTEEEPNKPVLDWRHLQKRFCLKCHYMKLRLMCVVVWMQLRLLGPFFFSEASNANQYVAHFDIIFEQLSDYGIIYAFFQKDSAVAYCKQF
jgi:hypothetical protein